jgi:signal transduction histidine kinase
LVSTLSLRIRFGLVVAAVATGAALALVWIASSMENRSAAFWFALSGGLLITLLVDWGARPLIYRRLAHMREALAQASAGDLTTRVPVERLDEIGVIAAGLNELFHGLERLNEAADDRLEAANLDFRQRSLAIADSHRQLARLGEELAKAGRLAALGQAAANMAHQIGTPLNLISGYIQLLIQSTPPESATGDRLKAIQEQVAKITAIVRATLDYSRGPATPPERVDLGALVRRVCQLASPLLEEAQVTIELRTPQQPAELLADAVRLELALLNLISNSVDAMPAGGTLMVSVERSDDRLHLEVADTGSGISQELLTHIFDPWVTSKAPGKGSGLGLSIVRQVVRSHGGTIQARNRPDRGACFSIDLPAAAADGQRAASQYAENPDR